MVNNRRRGHGWELEVIHDLKDVGYERAVSSRQESRTLDAQKVDVCYTDPFNFQCKVHTQKVNYPEIISQMPEKGVNVVLHKYAVRNKTNFQTIGKYAILKYSDFLDIIKHLNGKAS
jgi:hypothetical protein